MKFSKTALAAFAAAASLMVGGAAAAVTIPNDHASDTAKTSVSDDAKAHAAEAGSQAGDDDEATEVEDTEAKADETEVKDEETADTDEAGDEGGERPQNHGYFVSETAKKDYESGQDRAAAVKAVAQSDQGKTEADDDTDEADTDDVKADDTDTDDSQAVDGQAKADEAKGAHSGD